MKLYNHNCFIKVLFLVIVLIYPTSVFSKTKKVKVIAEKATIYLEPNINSFKIETVEKGTILTIFQRGKVRKAWYYVSFYSKKRFSHVSGFINASLVEPVEKSGETQKKKEGKEKAMEQKRKATVPINKEKKQKKRGKEKESIKITQKEIEKRVEEKQREAELKLPTVKPKKNYIKIGLNYFTPSEKVFKDIYGGGIMYGGEINIGVWKRLELWIDGGYFSKKGKLTYTEEETKLKIIPIGGGLKYVFGTEVLNFYIGAGLNYCYSEEANPIGNVSKGKLGYAGKIGSLFKVKGGLIIDLCISYSYCKIKPADYNVNIGGLKVGMGIGYKF